MNVSSNEPNCIKNLQKYLRWYKLDKIKKMRVTSVRYYYLLSIVIFFLFLPTYNRSPHRIKDHQDPYIAVSWHGDTVRRELHDSHLEDLLFAIYNKESFEQHLLPQDTISYRYNPNESVSGSHLSLLLEKLLLEIRTNQKTFTDFEVLKKRDFANDNTGLIILKFKDYPFVVKLFIETPESFTNPLDKGFDSMCFFYMGGGTSRYLNGFTRIKNLETIKYASSQHPYWSDRLDFPRKWFWLPKKSRYLFITGYNIGGPNAIKHCLMPAIYAVICDEIRWSRPFVMSKAEDRCEALALSNFLKQKIDLHINNYGIDYQNGKLVPIDFEHFPTVVGFKNIRTYDNYFEWYTDLASKWLYDAYGRCKSRRRIYQYQQYTNIINI